MARADRAGQFAPFAALKGYEEALRKKERIEVEKVELSEEMLEFLDYKISQIIPGNVITVVYYSEGAYLQKTGIVAKINKDARYLSLVTTDIAFDDIRDIII